MDLHDPVSAGTHLFTAAWALYATLILLMLTRGHGYGRWAVGGYGLSMVLLYLASGLFHGVRHDTLESFQLFQKCDKSAIFLLISGSYLPIFVYLLNGAWRRWCLIAMGLITAFGIASVWFWPSHPHSLLVGVYAGMGLLGLIPLPKYFPQIGWSGMVWVGGLCVTYLGGAVVEVMRWPVLIPGWVGPHELLHISDMGGTFIHFGFIVRYVIRRPPLA